MSVLIYGQPNCQWCKNSVAFCIDKGIEYDYIDIQSSEITRDDIKYLTTVLAPGAKTVPIIIVDGEWIGGYSDLVKLYQ